MLHILPTMHASNLSCNKQVVAGCQKLLQKVVGVRKILHVAPSTCQCKLVSLSDEVRSCYSAQTLAQIVLKLRRQKDNDTR